jgi:AcrR family transcriptional regulator
LPATGKYFQRARSDRAKQVRRVAILNAALRSFHKRDFEDLTVEEVARASGLAKGTVYLYFPTKESIFLELLLQELEEWLETLAPPLEKLATEPGPRERRLAALLATSAGERPTLRRLLSLLHQTLERNVDVETVRSFKLRVAALMGPTAERLEACLPRLQPGDGFRLMIHFHGLLIGVGQMADVSDVAEEALRAPELAGFRIDFASELTELLELILRGWKPAR